MKLTRESVQRVATLARLRLTADEETALAGELDRILGYMDKLNDLDTSNVPVFAHSNDVSETLEKLRDDKVVNRPNTDALLANAPERDKTFFRVPKIIE